MMRIGIDARLIGYTGLGRYVSELIERVPRLDPDNEYVLFLKPEAVPSFSSYNDNISIVPSISGIYNLSEQLTFKRMLQRADLDLLHVPHFNAPLLYKGKLIVTIHDLIQAQFPSTGSLLARIKQYGYDWSIKHNAKRAGRVLAVSEYTKQDLIKRYRIPDERIRVIHNGISDQFTRSSAEGKGKDELLATFGIDKPYLLYVGLHSHHKNLRRLIQAFKLVRGRGHDLQLVIVGKKDSRYTPDLEAEANRLSLRDEVVFTGFVDDEDLTALFDTASLFVFPSLYEGFGLPPLEALARGVPVVCSNTTALPEVLGEATVYFDPEDEQHMARVIDQVLSDPSQHQQMIEKGKDQIRQFSWENTAKETLQVYREAL